MLQLLLIRHAESVGNAEGRMVGQRHDPLTALGRWQARRLGDRLNHLSPVCIYASPLQRAAETAVILRQVLQAAQATAPPILYRPDLQEFQNGVFAGLTWAEASERHPQLCRRLMASSDWVPIPGAETLQCGRDRARRIAEQLLSHRNGDQVWVLSHHWILQQVVSTLLGSDRTWGFPLAHTGLIELRLDRDRWSASEQALNSSLWQIHRFNDAGHLEAASPQIEPAAGGEESGSDQS
ncbi:MAG: histidine phosphatase family protein [Elainellaceae cyanobacterium]